MVGVGFGLLDVGVPCGEPAAANDDQELEKCKQTNMNNFPFCTCFEFASEILMPHSLTYLARFFMLGSILLLNALAKFDFCSLIGICCGSDDDGVVVTDDDNNEDGGSGGGGVPFAVLSCCGIRSSSIGFGRNEPTLEFDVVVPLPVD